jgi:hypothetical protein
MPEPEHKEFVDKAGEKFGANLVACIERFQNTVKDKPVSLAVIEEPPLLPKQGRFLSKPIRSGLPGWLRSLGKVFRLGEKQV